MSDTKKSFEEEVGKEERICSDSFGECLPPKDDATATKRKEEVNVVDTRSFQSQIVATVKQAFLWKNITTSHYQTEVSSWNKTLLLLIILFVFFVFCKEKASLSPTTRKNRKKRTKIHHFKKKKRKKKNMTTMTEGERCGFPQFNQLHEDVIVHILSFLSDVPFELFFDEAANTNNNHSLSSSSSRHARPRSSLTGRLNLVCHQFHDIANSDFLWKAAMERLLKKDPQLWKTGLLKVMQDRERQQQQEETTTTTNDSKPSKNNYKKFQKIGITSNDDIVIQQAMKRLEIVHFKDLFRHVFEHYIRIRRPVFYMPGTVEMGRPISLHFFEPRYRLMMAELMRPYPPEYMTGQAHFNIVAQDEEEEDDDDAQQEQQDASSLEPPSFIYAYRAPLAPSSPACLVQVHRCLVYRYNGTSDVMLVPQAYCIIEKLWERPQSGRLYYAQAIRLGTSASRQLYWEERTRPIYSPSNILLAMAASLQHNNDDEEDDDDDEASENSGEEEETDR